MLAILAFVLHFCGCWCASQDDYSVHNSSTVITSSFHLSTNNTEQLNKLAEFREKIWAHHLNQEDLSRWRLFARMHSAHYATQLLEGGSLTPDCVHAVWEGSWVQGTDRDVSQVKGYLKALELIDQWAEEEGPLTSAMVKTMNELMAGVRQKTGDDERDMRAEQLQQLLLEDVVYWVTVKSEVSPWPVKAGIALYQVVHKQPFHASNGTTAMLLAQLVLRLGNYHLDGLNCIERYYALNPQAYHDAIAVGNDTEAGCSSRWIDYFLDSLVATANNTLQRLKLRHQIIKRP